MAADGVPNAPLTCSAYQHASRTCSKSVVPSLANIGAVVASSPFASAMPWSVGYANSLWMAILAPLPRRRELQSSALMFAQVPISILSIIFTGRHCGLISPCEPPQLCNPTHAARSGLVQPFVAAHFAAVVRLIGSTHHRRDLSAVLVLEICMRLRASRRANQGLAVIAHRRRC